MDKVLKQRIASLFLVVGLVAGACSSSPTQDERSGPSTTLSPTAEPTEADARSSETETNSPVPLELGDPDIDPAEIGEVVSLSISFDAEVYEHPALLLQTADAAGAGAVEAVYEGRRAGSLHKTTLAIRVDDWVLGDVERATEAGLLFLEVTHSPLVSSEEIALGIPRDSRVVFVGYDFSEWDASDPIENPAGGRAAGSDAPMFSVPPQGLWFVDGARAVKFNEPNHGTYAAWTPGPEDANAEAFLLQALRSDPDTVVIPPEPEVCGDFSELDVDAISGISDELRSEIKNVLATDDCITPAEYEAFLAEHPSLLDADLSGALPPSHDDGHDHTHEDGE